MKLEYIVCALALFFMNSCKPSKSEDSQRHEPTVIPTGVFWKLDQLEGRDISVPETGWNEIGFTLYTDNTISGYAGCNQFSGTYEYGSANKIKFSPMRATKMFCADMQFIESSLLGVFMDVSNYRSNGNQLEFLGKDGTTLAVFKKSIVPAEAITNKYWKLKTIRDESIEMTENQKRESYFKLKSDDQTVTGFTGCNTLFGSFSLGKSGKIQFTHIATTLMACPDIEIKEAEFVQVFEHANTYVLDNDELTLKRGND